jgi:hypothetical protein
LLGKRGKDIEDALKGDPELGPKFSNALLDSKYPPPPEARRFVQQSNRWRSWDNLNLANPPNVGTPLETKFLPILIFDSNDRQALPFGFATDDKAVEAVKEALREADRMLFVEFDRDAKKLIVYELRNTGNNKSLTDFVNGLEKVNELPVDELRKRIVKTVKGEVKKIIDFECKGSGLTEEDIGAIVARVYKDVVKGTPTSGEVSSCFLVGYQGWFQFPNRSGPAENPGWHLAGGTGWAGLDPARGYQ